MKNTIINRFKTCFQCGSKTFKRKSISNNIIHLCSSKHCHSYIYRYLKNDRKDNTIYASSYSDNTFITTVSIESNNLKPFYNLFVSEYDSSNYMLIKITQYKFESIIDLFDFQKKLIDYRCLE